MISKTGKSPLFRKGLKRISKKVVISFITILFFIILLFVCIRATSNKEINLNKNTTSIQERVETNIVNQHIADLSAKGYENVTAKITWSIQFAEDNNIPVRRQIIQYGKTLEETIIDYYDYFATYYSINIDNTTYLFKNQAEVDSFLAQIKKYDNTKYEIKTITKLVNNESKQEDLNTIVSTKKAQAEAKIAISAYSSSSSQSTGELQSYAHNLVINQYGWSEADYLALVKLWDRESGWNPNTHNKSSGAHGIPQSLPASKMASEGVDYYTNGYTQIRWGLKYIQGRYGSPSAAWAYFQSVGWY